MVPSLGRGARRKGPNLVVFWQLGGGGKGGDEETLQLRKRLCGVHETVSRLESAFTAHVWSYSLSAARFGNLDHAQWRGPAMEMATNVVVRKASGAPARAPGFATDRAMLSRRSWLGCCLRVLEVPGSKERRGPVFWEAGATAPRRRRATSNFRREGLARSLDEMKPTKTPCEGH